jgi:hypothetical protein
MGEGLGRRTEAREIAAVAEDEHGGPQVEHVDVGEEQAKLERLALGALPLAARSHHMTSHDIGGTEGSSCIGGCRKGACIGGCRKGACIGRWCEIAMVDACGRRWRVRNACVVIEDGGNLGVLCEIALHLLQLHTVGVGIGGRVPCPQIMAWRRRPLVRRQRSSRVVEALGRAQAQVVQVVQ